MDFWVTFWTVFFVVSLILFAGLAVVTTIGGLFDMRSLFRSLARHSEPSGEGLSEDRV